MSFRAWIEKLFDPGPPDPTWDPKGHDQWYIDRGLPFQPTSFSTPEGAGKPPVTLAPAPLGTPRPECKTPPPSFAEGLRELAEPEAEKFSRHWRIREGHGYTIGHASESKRDATVTVKWEPAVRDVIKRTEWVDIAALKDSFTRDDQNFTRDLAYRYAITAPVRFTQTCPPREVPGL